MTETSVNCQMTPGGQESTALTVLTTLPDLSNTATVSPTGAIATRAMTGVHAVVQMVQML